VQGRRRWRSKTLRGSRSLYGWSANYRNGGDDGFEPPAFSV
jgi:hypothetical protein